MDTIRRMIIAQISDRLHDILIANGFSSDVGQHVHRGITYIGANEVPGVTMLPGVESAERNYAETVRRMPVDFIAVVSLTSALDNPSDKAEDLFGDMCFALLGVRSVITFSFGNREITAGMTIKGASSNIEGRVVDVILTGGSWAGGTAAGNLVVLHYSSGAYTVGENLTISGLVSARVAAFNVPAEYGGFVYGVQFMSGGISTYPAEGDVTLMVEVSLDFIYSVTNNPYTQGG